MSGKPVGDILCRFLHFYAGESLKELTQNQVLSVTDRDAAGHVFFVLS